MLRFVVPIVAVVLGSGALAQSGAPHSHSKHQKAAPAAQNPEDPNDVSNVPRNVQDWVGSTVDDILTGSGKVLDDADGKR